MPGKQYLLVVIFPYKYINCQLKDKKCLLIYFHGAKLNIILKKCIPTIT